MITYLPASERTAVPWKNGGGVTREVAVFPAGSNMDDFDWRISMAEVTQPGPFSIFPGVDRYLTVLKGVLGLDMFGGRRITLGAHEGMTFRGDLPVMGVPLEPVTDLNVMTRRGRFRASVTQLGGGQTSAHTSVLIAMDSGPCRIGDQDFFPRPYDAYLCDEPYTFLTRGIFFHICLTEGS